MAKKKQKDDEHKKDLLGSLYDIQLKVEGIGGLLRHYRNEFGDAERHLDGVGLVLQEVAEDISNILDEVQQKNFG